MKKILQPLDTPKISLKNRLIMPPMATSKARDDGSISHEILEFYNSVSTGGHLSLIIVEHSFISQEGKASSNQMSIASDHMVESLKDLAATIHKNGSKAVMQINHAGSAADRDITGMAPLGPSPVKNPRKGTTPVEITASGIKKIVTDFAAAARRCKEAGFDGVEIHSAHGYLLNQFFSPLTNRREDEYGGSLKNRIRIHLEIIEAVKKEVGDDYPLLLRLGASDYTDGGTTTEDSKIASLEFEKAGIDILDISGGFCGYTMPQSTEQGYFHPLTASLKEVVSIPVILTGGVTDIHAANELLENDKADLIGVGRAIFQNHHWTRDSIKSLY